MLVMWPPLLVIPLMKRETAVPSIPHPLQDAGRPSSLRIRSISAANAKATAKRAGVWYLERLMTSVLFQRVHACRLKQARGWTPRGAAGRRELRAHKRGGLAPTAK